MHRVIIYKNKIVLVDFDEITQTWVEKEILHDGERLSIYLNKLVEIKEDVTVEDFMNHLKKFEKEIDYSFVAFLNQIPFNVFYEDMKNTLGEGSADLEAVEMLWNAEIINQQLIVNGTLRGWLTPKKAEELEINPDIPQDISFLPLFLWKNALIELNEVLVLRDMGELENLTETILYEGFYRWTFFEFMSNFLQEISINGTPEEREKFLLEIEDKSYKLDELAKDKEQAEFWLNAIQIELEEKKEKLQKALDEEEYESIYKIKDAIQALEQEINDIHNELNKSK